ncbi:MAG: hypothetical protein FWF69_05200 [Firmicutes bacterium]|nr:hypothetical protein [Bacillota bacterium]
MTHNVATQNFQHPPVEWEENSTYIQMDNIVKDLGIFDSPDELFAAHRQNIGRFKAFVFRYFVRHLMNTNIEKIRSAK